MAFPEVAHLKDKRIVRGVLAMLDANIDRASERGNPKGRIIPITEQVRLMAISQIALTAKTAITSAIEGMPDADPRQKRIAAINSVAALAAQEALMADMSFTLAFGENVIGMRQNRLSPANRNLAESRAYPYSNRADQYASVVYALGYAQLRDEPDGEQLLQFPPEAMQVIAAAA